MVFVHAKIGELKVKDLSQKLQGISGFIFHLQLCEGQQLKHQILLKSHTEWVALPQLSIICEIILSIQTVCLSRGCSVRPFFSNKEWKAEMDHSNVSIRSFWGHGASQRECWSVERFRCPGESVLMFKCFSSPFFCFPVDISQVQCIKSYQAQEHDELTLEKADILHAKTITSDGENLHNVLFNSNHVPNSCCN